MATFFKRRYMRPEFGTTEKLLGLLLIALIAGVVIYFVEYSLHNKDYLFTVSEEARAGQDIPHESRIAAELLPGLTEAGWKPRTEPTAAEAESAALQEDFRSAIEAFEVARVFCRGYESANEPICSIDVTICDAMTPAQAMGLWHARKPGEANTLAVGKGGWVASDRAGFWNGRYYTELLISPADDAGAEALTQAAAAVAAFQLGYGGDWPEEDLLPPQGRVAGTLRYVHSALPDEPEIRRAFLVDLDGGATAWVRNAGSASEAGRVMDGFAERPAAKTDGPLTIISDHGETLAAFASGPYVVGAMGAQRGAVLAAVKTSHQLASAKAGGTASNTALAVASAAQPDAAGANPFPPPELSGWRIPAKVARFTPDTLYEKINGRAGLYLQYKVVGMTFGTYFHQTKRDQTIDVYWYDMGEPQNALGAYKAEAPADGTSLDLGSQGYTIGGAVFFIKGASYLQVLPSTEGEETAQAAMNIAQRIAGSIVSDDDGLWALKVLPRENRVEDSFEYIAQNAFDLEFLSEVYTADYDMDGGRITLFVHKAADEAEANELLKQYEAFFNEYGQIAWRSPDASRHIMAGDMGGLIDVIFVKGAYLGGVTGAEDMERAKKAAILFYDQLAQ